MSKKFYTGLNIQWPISNDIIEGNKIIETRTYPISKKYIGKEMLLIETPGPKGNFKSRIIGVIRFVECFKYKSKKEFYNDTDRHLVDKNSPWAWKDKEKWGWKVEVIEKFPTPIEYSGQKGIIYTKNIVLS